MTTDHPHCTEAADVACEASRYLAVVELFASLDADPHARARAAHARRVESASPTHPNHEHERR
jgi:hypothetical protein